MTGSRALALLLFMLGVAALLLGIKINAEFGARIAADASGKENFSYWHVLTDTAGAILAASGGVMAAKRWRLRSVMSFGLALAFASYSASALIGYGFAQRYAVEQAKTINMAREAESHKIRSKAIEDQTWWLRGTATSTGSSVDRRAAIEASTKLVTSASTSTFEKVSAADLMGDAHTGAISYITGGSETQVRTVLIIAAAVLLITAKLSGFYFAPILWVGGGPNSSDGSPTPPGGSRMTRSHVRRRLPRMGSGTVPQITSPAKNAQPAGLVTVPNSPATVPNAPRNSPEQLVREFWRQCTVANETSVLTATAVYVQFCDWARQRSVTPPTQTAFGRLLTQLADDLGVKRVSMPYNLIGYEGRAFTTRPRLVASA